MATIANQYDPNDSNANSNAGGGGTVMPSTSSGIGSAASTPSSTPLNRPSPSGTPNVQAYLNANQGAGQQLATGITNNTQQQANQLNQNVSQSQNALNSQYQPLQQNLGANAQQTIQTAFQNPQSLLDSYNAAKSQTSTSTPLTSDQQAQANQYSQFQNLNTGGYDQGIQNYNAAGQQQANQIQNQLSNLNQVTGSTTNEMGRNQLLQNLVGQPTYNQGQQTLDSLFLQAQPGVLQNLQGQLKNIQTNANQNVNSFNSDTQAKLAALQGLSGADKQQIQNLFLNGPANATGTGQMGLNQIGQNVQNEYNALAQSAPQAQAATLQAFQNNQFTPQQLQQLGLTAGQQTWGLTPDQLMASGSYANTPLLAANQGGNAQAATPEEFARYNALNQLAGGPAGTAQSNIFGTATQAGGYSPVTFNAGNAQNAIDAQKQAVTGTDFQTALSGLLQNLPNQGGPRPGFGGFSPAQSSNPLYNNFLSQLNQGVANKTLTPDALNSLIQNYIANPGPSQDTAVLNQIFSPFTQYYKNEYSPDVTSAVNMASQVAPSAGGAPMQTGTPLNRPLGQTILGS